MITASSYLLDALNLFRMLDPDIGAQTVATFLIIADRPGITQIEVGEKLGMSASAASRNIQYLSKTVKVNRKGLDLVVAIRRSEDRRKQICYLTPKGTTMVQQLNKIVK